MCCVQATTVLFGEHAYPCCFVLGVNVLVGAGPSGTSVREISKQTGADIKSWTEKPDNKTASSRPTRSFVIEVMPPPFLYHSLAPPPLSSLLPFPPPPLAPSSPFPLPMMFLGIPCCHTLQRRWAGLALIFCCEHTQHCPSTTYNTKHAYGNLHSLWTSHECGHTFV